MSDKKKFMPAITNYLSDSDDDINESIDSTINVDIDQPQTQINYAEWKRLQKVSPNLSNGKSTQKKSTQTPLGDISSCEDDSKYDDADPIYKIMNCLADKEEFRRRNDCVRRKHKKPSHFLLFSRMKQHKHYDCSFSDLCQIVQASWDNLQPSENEELMGNIDYRIRDFKETLEKFKILLLPDNYTSRPKLNSMVSSVKRHEEKEVSPIILPIENNKPRQHHSKIPDRLQSLAGNASIYNAPAKSKRISRHSFKSYKDSISSYTSDTTLSYVSGITETINCYFPGCENKPIEDYRWDGQYCSAKCLIKDCNLALKNWLTNQKEALTQEGVSESEKEVLSYLASPMTIDSDESIARDENLFESLQNKFNNSGSDFSHERQRRNLQPFDSDNDSDSKLDSLENHSTDNSIIRNDDVYVSG